MIKIYKELSSGYVNRLRIHPTYKCLILLLFIGLYFTSSHTLAQSGACYPSLTHHFGLDEKQSGSYVDFVTGATATCTNCPSPVTGVFDGAQSFDGSNDGIQFGKYEAFEWGPNSDFTIELWVKTSADPSGNQIMIGRKAAEHNMIWWIGMDKDGHALFALWDHTGKGATIKYESKKINDGKWHHIVVVRDGRTKRSKFYVDGFATANFEIPYEGSFDKSTSPITIGYLELEHGYHFKGELDEIMVYNGHALSEVEARARYNNGNGNYCGPKQAAPIITSEPVTYGTAGQAYRYDVQATGAPAPTFAIVSGPAGLSINATTGEITWAPTAGGTFDVTVKASNVAGAAEQSFKIVVKKSVSDEVGLLHHWMLHELSGTEYKDYYTPYHAKSVGGSRPEPVTGVVSGAQHFDGTEDALDVIGSKNFDWKPDAGFTIELWMRTDVSKSTNRVLIGRQARDSPVHWWLGITEAGQARFVLFDLEFKGITAGVGDAGPRLDDGVWHQIVAVRDGGSGATKVYVDGEQVASGSYNHTVGFESSSEINIGYLGGQDPGLNGYRYEGDLDEVKLFGRPLSADEIRQNYIDVYNARMELVKFEGMFKNGVVVLDWETLNEVNCKSFTIERSADNENFEAIGEVNGSGNSTQAISYTFTDENPLAEDAYYRLKINKTDGSFTYSNAILIQNKSMNTTTFVVYPNPVTQETEQEVSVAIEHLVPDETVQFFISDMTGRRIMEQQFTVDGDGNLTFNVPLAVTTKLRSGMYMFTIATKIKNITRKLLVVH